MEASDASPPVDMNADKNAEFHASRSHARSSPPKISSAKAVLPPHPPAAAARASGDASPPLGAATSRAHGVMPLTSSNLVSLAPSPRDPHASPQQLPERPGRRSEGSSAADVLARHRQLAASLPLRKTAGEPPQDSPLSWSPTHVEPLSSLKARDSPRSRSPSHSPSKSPMKSLLFGGTERQGTRTRRPARSSRTEQEEIPPLGLSSKNAFSAAPRIVSMSRGASAETKVETTTKPPELESMREKFCVKCGNLMGVEYQFCQKCGSACALLSPRTPAASERCPPAAETPAPDTSYGGLSPAQAAALPLSDSQTANAIGGHSALNGVPKKSNPRNPMHKKSAGCFGGCLGAAVEEPLESRCGTRRESVFLMPALDHSTNSSGAEKPKYDIFISYRASADLEHAKDLFRQLSSREIEEGGRRRKISVFWDRVSLCSGEAWERGVECADALCNSSVIVPIISRKTFITGTRNKPWKEERSQAINISDMTADSAADYVLWDWCLALQLVAMRRKYPSVVLPVLVGDLRDAGFEEEYYTDFFTSDCAPAEIPDVHVHKLHDRLRFFLHTRMHCGRNMADAVMDPQHCIKCQSLRKWTVYEIVDEIFRLQAISVSGLRAPAWNDCYDVIVATVFHVCAQRDVESLQFSRPLGQEVVDWLHAHALSDYAATFARLQLDSLHKVSKLSPAQIVAVCEAAEEDEIGAKCVTGHATTFPVGVRIVLEEAVKSLKRDPRSLTLSQRLSCFTDAHSCGFLNILWRQNVLEVLLGNVWVRSLLVLLLLLIGALLGALAWHDHQNDPWMGAVSIGRVISYQVQSSLNGTQWDTLQCDKGPCIFDSHGNIFDTWLGFEHTSSNYFPHPVKARYIRILPVQWRARNSMRVGLLGSPEPIEGVATVGSRVRVLGQRSKWNQAACAAKLGALCSRYTVLRLRDLQTCPQAGIDTEKCVMIRQGEDLLTKCFEVIRQSRFNFTEAEIQCQAWGGNLASILSEEEQAIAENVAYSVKMSHGVHDVWIGYRAVESTGKPVDSSSKFAKWIWVDGSEASYTNLARQKCFKVFMEPKTWHQAQRACEQWDRESSTVSSQDTYSDGRSGLASVTSSEDARFLSELALDVAQKYANQNTAKAHTMQQIYIGFNRRHTKDFVWSDGSGYPLDTGGSAFKQDCTAVTSASSYTNWEDVACHHELPYACSKTCHVDDALEWRVSPSHATQAACAKMSHLDDAFAGLVNSHHVLQQQDAVTLDVFRVRSIAGALMQGGISVSPLARVAANFSALYLMILFIPAALNMLGHALFSTPLGAEWAFAANLVYAIMLSALGLILIFAEKSLAKLMQTDWRAAVMVRVQASILVISVLLFAAHKILPQSLVLVAFLATVSAVGISVIQPDAAFEEPWWRNADAGVIILVLGYLTVAFAAMLMTLRREGIRMMVLGRDRSEYRTIWVKTLENGARKETLASIHAACSRVHHGLHHARRAHVALYAWWDQWLFWVGWAACGAYGKTGKRRQDTANIDVLFQEATLIAPCFFFEIRCVLQLASPRNSGSAFREMLGIDQDAGGTTAAAAGNTHGGLAFLLMQGPAKRPARALEKVSRKYYRDPRCLTDLVRCSILMDSIEEVYVCLNAILTHSATADQPASESADTSNANDEAAPKIFSITNITDTFSPKEDPKSGRRSIRLHLEVAWDAAAGASSSYLHFLSVDEWHSHPHTVRRHICEVELMLRDTYLHSISCHVNVVRFRDLLAC